MKMKTKKKEKEQEEEEETCDMPCASHVTSQNDPRGYMMLSPSTDENTEAQKDHVHVHILSQLGDGLLCLLESYYMVSSVPFTVPYIQWVLNDYFLIEYKR